MSTQGKVITCRAAVNWEAKKPFVIETVEVAPPQAGEVRIKMKSTGVCHSDLHIVEGCDPNWPFPSVLGHEGAGIVESVGEGVTEFAPGDLVIPLFEGYCGECDYCKNPKTNQCQKQSQSNLMLDGTSRITCKGQSLTQMSSVSTFSEYTVAPTMNLTKVNPKAPANRLCLAGCCIPTGYGAAMEAAKVHPGATCAVWGLGGVGMCVVMGCRDSGASRIIGVDTNPSKFPLAKEFGCTDVINPKELTKPIPEVIAEMSKGGADYCFVSVGVVEAMEEAFRSCHHAWGETIVIGLTDLDAKIKAGVWDLVLGRKLRGCLFGSYKAKLKVPELVDKIMEGKIEMDKLISHVLPLEKINEGFEMMTSGKSLRTVIDFELPKN